MDRFDSKLFVELEMKIKWILKWKQRWKNKRKRLREKKGKWEVIAIELYTTYKDLCDVNRFYSTRLCNIRQTKSAKPLRRKTLCIKWIVTIMTMKYNIHSRIHYASPKIQVSKYIIICSCIGEWLLIEQNKTKVYVMSSYLAQIFNQWDLLLL